MLKEDSVGYIKKFFYVAKVKIDRENGMIHANVRSRSDAPEEKRAERPPNFEDRLILAA